MDEPARIEDYALIGDCQSAALVGDTGSVDWLCLPRFDSGACMAALLGDAGDGRWLLAPDGAGRASRRRYRPGTLVLETEWDTPTGAVRVVDFMPHRGEAPDVVRVVEGLSGTVRMRFDLRLRFEYGRRVPWVHRAGGRLAGVAGPDAMWLSSPVPVEDRGHGHMADFTVEAGEKVPFVLTWHASHLPAPRPVDALRVLRDTEDEWRKWTGSLSYDGTYRDAVVRSLITLKALTYAPTGGLVAAPTTSLPETPGGVRNWDYRYCWLRDATMTLTALLRSGYTEEAGAWRRWLERALAGSPEDIQIMYGVAGERLLHEWEVDWLPGYEGSRPVRVGNAAAAQLQLDVPGEVLNALYLARRAGLPPEQPVWALQRALLDHVERHWHEPDEGLWEVRGGPRHFVHSKVMCWVAFDRGVRMAEEFGMPGPAGRWRRLRDRVRREVCEKGFDARRGTFTRTYGSADLDAALLMIPMTGFLRGDDPRVRGTVDAVWRELGVDGLVRRYVTRDEEGADGLSGQEGAFVACSFWMADALRLAGREDEARELFERLLGLRNDVGLLAEQYDPHARRQLGNFPQAFSHVPLVHTAYELDGHRTLPHLE
ncbi:glycoside hydrolase family 15 protein [Actinomadura miaoliensis]|uniref:Glycoside hydrolase family 15 protein n=1 Tax=Actinomadura miaoliensis TaxID=430685 RepID=A0ABP7VIN8_9ACTN